MQYRKFRNLALSAACLAALPGGASAALVYGFDGGLLTATETITHTTASALSLTSVVGATSCTGLGAPGFACGPFGSGTVSFTITAQAGYVLDATRFSFDERNPTSVGPTAFAVYTSADGYTDAILSATLGINAPTYTSHSVALALTGLTETLGVRIVSTGRDSTPVGPWYLDNLRLDGVATLAGTVPEPATMSLGLLALAALGATRAGRRQSPAVC